jgi:hypothetical protein
LKLFKTSLIISYYNENQLLQAYPTLGLNLKLALQEYLDNDALNILSSNRSYTNRQRGMLSKVLSGLID